MFIISSIESYLNWVRNCSTLESAGQNWQQHHLYFRGQANCEWKLQPSVFVHKENEYELLQDAYRHAWKYLQDYPTDLEKMIVLQHCGLHTRLLDWTSNPLIALYFACAGENDKDKDGKVFCYCAKGDENIRIPAILAKVIANGVNLGGGLEQYLQNECENYYIRSKETPIDEMTFETWKEQFFKPHFFLSPFNNTRITAQRGAFVITPLHVQDSVAGSHFNIGSIEIMDSMHNTQAVIDRNSKTNILKELSMCGIDESTVYPDFGHLLSFLNNSNSKSDRELDL